MSDLNQDTDSEKAKGNPPTHIAKVRHGSGEGATYEQIGAAWMNEKGEWLFTLRGPGKTLRLAASFRQLQPAGLSCRFFSARFDSRWLTRRSEMCHVVDAAPLERLRSKQRLVLPCEHVKYLWGSYAPGAASFLWTSLGTVCCSEA